MSFVYLKFRILRNLIVSYAIHTSVNNRGQYNVFSFFLLHHNQRSIKLLQNVIADTNFLGFYLGIFNIWVMSRRSDWDPYATDRTIWIFVYIVHWTGWEKKEKTPPKKSIEYWTLRYLGWKRERESEFSVHHTPIHTYMQHSQSSIIRTLSSNCKRWLNFEWFTTVEIVFEYSCMHFSICLSPSFSLPHSSAVVCVSSCVCMCLCECNRVAFLPVSMELSGQILILIGYRKHTKWLHCILQKHPPHHRNNLMVFIVHIAVYCWSL